MLDSHLFCFLIISDEYVIFSGSSFLCKYMQITLVLRIDNKIWGHSLMLCNLLSVGLPQQLSFMGSIEHMGYFTGSIRDWRLFDLSYTWRRYWSTPFWAGAHGIYGEPLILPVFLVEVESSWKKSVWSTDSLLSYSTRQRLIGISLLDGFICIFNSTPSFSHSWSKSGDSDQVPIRVAW